MSDGKDGKDGLDGKVIPLTDEQIRYMKDKLAEYVKDYVRRQLEGSGSGGGGSGESAGDDSITIRILEILRRFRRIKSRIGKYFPDYEIDEDRRVTIYD